ncbi:hypothetical protein IFM89_011485 [Coptis chinensis]|uniref:Peptidase S8/S53 domain-containing protein n=1 Tax=Coptis chinensis TaxID=261450 RepID=A0A835IAB2_9MAGN|nr:hypothetical protein IFM89_011485 [Coptis chinensis]
MAQNEPKVIMEILVSLLPSEKSTSIPLNFLFGNQVTNVSFFGLAQGNARGTVPSAGIAVYKVCWEEGCDAQDILSAFDDAISVSVDILSVSLGGEKSDDYLIDPIAIGAFHAMQNGILTSQSAVNNGPEQGSVSSIAPWILSVATSNTDRKIIDKVILGWENGKPKLAVAVAVAVGGSDNGMVVATYLEVGSIGNIWISIGLSIENKAL